MLPEDQRGNGDIKYFSRYALCARGLRDFLAKAGVPYFSLDAFRNIARQVLGNDRLFATCSWHTMYNAKKKGRVGTIKRYFGRTKARGPNWSGPCGGKRCAETCHLGRSRLRIQIVKEENGAFSWTLLKHIETGMCMFGRLGSNNPVEQQHAKQLKDRGQNPFKFLYAWVVEITKIEGEII